MKWNENDIYERLKGRETSLAVVGLGYVGLPVALEFARHFNVTGYDIDSGRIASLEKMYEGSGVRFTSSENALGGAGFHIITVPTPIDDDRKPDLFCLLEATRTVPRHLKPGDYVVYESTVSPGCTENECVPVLEECSGLKAGEDFKVGYSPERVNPNDMLHAFANTPKVVAACDEVALKCISQVYSSAVGASIYHAPSIRVAEASKMLENAQRSINIALMNEFSILFSNMGIDMAEVIGAASTKWNFVQCRPGLVGGHCIPVDPHYVISLAENLGVDTPVLKAGCAVNEGMAEHVVNSVLRECTVRGIEPREARVLLMGITYKENIDDIRNSVPAEICRLLGGTVASADVVDPYADPEKVASMYGINLVREPSGKYDIIIVAVAHDGYAALDEDWFLSVSSPDALLADLVWLYRGKIRSLGYWSL